MLLSLILVISPVDYARAYCSLRKSGMAEMQAVRVATRMSLAPGPAPAVVEGVRADVFAAQVEAMGLCPDQ